MRGFFAALRMTSRNKQLQEQTKTFAKTIATGNGNGNSNGNGNGNGNGEGTALFVAEDGLGVYVGGSAGGDPAGDEGYGG